MKIKMVFMMFCWLGLIGGYAGARQGNTDTPGNKKEQKVLVFTRTEGYRHGSISDGVALLRRLGKANDFKVDRTENADVFNTADLEDYDLVVFLSTTGNVLNETQQEAFENFIGSGGSFMGMHAAADTEYDWPWYGNLVGAYFESHPEVQQAAVRVVNRMHPSTSFLPEIWERTDEWYNFKEMKEGVNVLLDLDETTYEGGKNGKNHPVAWYQEIDGGRSFYTAGGHTGSSYREPLFEEHILRGVLWCLHRAD